MPKRVMIADDSPEDRISVGQHLRTKGWDVIEAQDPNQAIESLKENEETPFDAIILDLVMPENNPRGGEQVLQFLVEHDKRRGQITPVILATVYGYNGPAPRAKAFYPEAVKCILTKTYSLKELDEALASCLAPKSPGETSPLSDSTALKADNRATDTILADTTAVFMHKLLNEYKGIVAIVRSIEERLKSVSEKERSVLSDLPVRLEQALESTSYVVQRFRNVLGRHPGVLNPISIHSILADVGQHFSSDLRSKLKFDLVQEECEVLGDYELLWHLFENLVSNALEAIQERRRGFVIIKTAVDREAQFVRIRVHDNGRGIRLEDLPRIFDLNYSTKSQGLGIGLYLVRRAAGIHRGQVECQSELSKGTTFTVSLPLAVEVQQQTP